MQHVDISWIFRKFFTFIIILNGIGLLLAALNIWTYPRHYTGAFVLGNLLFAILMRNELFGRLLYLFVNKAFAKVCYPIVDSFRLIHDLISRLSCSGHLYGGD